MKRVLFVDDDVATLEGLRNVLRGERTRWSMEFAAGGEPALALLSASHFDVVVTDMLMPGMNGVELLERVRRDHPSAARIVLSGSADARLVGLASAVAHQQLAKPCDALTLRAAIEQACVLQDVLDSEAVRKAVGLLGALPAAPRVYGELTRALSDEEVPLKTLARIVEQDVGISTRVLKFVNSAYYGLAKKISSIDHAIVCLGIGSLRHLVLGIEVFAVAAKGVPGAYAPDALERHSLLAARIARRVLGSPGLGETAFAAGLLHDSGKLVLASRVPEHCARAVAWAAREGAPLVEAERHVVGADHAQIGAYLLSLWGLPRDIVDAVARHHTRPPAEQGLDVATAVRVANILAHDVLPDDPPLSESADAANLLRGVSDKLESWRQAAQDEAGLVQGTAALAGGGVRR
jgi:HD-like signal output (HDOD) protein/CheY-like chemotaxis protein